MKLHLRWSRSANWLSCGAARIRDVDGKFRTGYFTLGRLLVILTT